MKKSKSNHLNNSLFPKILFSLIISILLIPFTTVHAEPDEKMIKEYFNYILTRPDLSKGRVTVSDVNGDGVDELIVLHNAKEGYLGSYSIFEYKNNKVEVLYADNDVNPTGSKLHRSNFISFEGKKGTYIAGPVGAMLKMYASKVDIENGEAKYTEVDYDSMGKEINNTITYTVENGKIVFGEKMKFSTIDFDSIVNNEIEQKSTTTAVTTPEGTKGSTPEVKNANEESTKPKSDVAEIIAFDDNGNEVEPKVASFELHKEKGKNYWESSDVKKIYLKNYGLTYTLPEEIRGKAVIIKDDMGVRLASKSFFDEEKFYPAYGFEITQSQYTKDSLYKMLFTPDYNIELYRKSDSYSDKDATHKEGVAEVSLLLEYIKVEKVIRQFTLDDPNKRITSGPQINSTTQYTENTQTTQTSQGTQDTKPANKEPVKINKDQIDTSKIIKVGNHKLVAIDDQGNIVEPSVPSFQTGNLGNQYWDAKDVKQIYVTNYGLTFTLTEDIREKSVIVPTDKTIYLASKSFFDEQKFFPSSGFFISMESAEHPLYNRLITPDYYIILYKKSDAFGPGDDNELGISEVNYLTTMIRMENVVDLFTLDDPNKEITLDPNGHFIPVENAFGNTNNTNGTKYTGLSTNITLNKTVKTSPEYIISGIYTLENSYCLMTQNGAYDGSLVPIEAGSQMEAKWKKEIVNHASKGSTFSHIECTNFDINFTDNNGGKISYDNIIRGLTTGRYYSSRMELDFKIVDNKVIFYHENEYTSKDVEYLSWTTREEMVKNAVAVLDSAYIYMVDNGGYKYWMAPIMKDSQMESKWISEINRHIGNGSRFRHISTNNFIINFTSETSGSVQYTTVLQGISTGRNYQSIMYLDFTIVDGKVMFHAESED